MDKRPGFRKRIALELARSIRRNKAKLHELARSFGNVRFGAMHPAVIAAAIAMYRQA